MNRNLDLALLRNEWASMDLHLEQRLRLDHAALRATLMRKTARAFQWHSYWQYASSLLSVVVLLWLCVFIWQQFNQVLLVLSATALAALALMQIFVDVSEIFALRRLDYAAPIAQVQSTISTLRMRRMQFVWRVIVCSVFLWLPITLVVFKGLLNVDLYSHLDMQFVFRAQLIGLVCIPALMMVGRLAARRWSGSPRYERLIDELGGYTWLRARRQLGEWTALIERDGDAAASGGHKDGVAP